MPSTMKKYNPPPHREFPGLLPATEENINRLLASARRKRHDRAMQKILSWVLVILAALLLVIFTWVIL